MSDDRKETDVSDAELSELFARLGSATEDLAPPSSFTSRVMAATRAPRRGTWTYVGSLGRLAVPFAAAAAAAAMWLAWSVERAGDRVDGAALADEIAEVP